MIQQEEFMSVSLKAMAEKTAEAGWDQPPQLLALYTQTTPPEGEMCGVWMLGAIGIADPKDIGVNPPAFLEQMAEALLLTKEPDGIQFVMALAKDSFAGIAFIVEGWFRGHAAERSPGVLEPAFPESCSAESMAEGLEDGHEVRNILCVDTSGRFYMVTQPRDRDIRIAVTQPHEPAAGGVVAKAIRDLVAAIGRHCPPGTVDLLAVRDAVDERDYTREGELWTLRQKGQ